MEYSPNTGNGFGLVSADDKKWKQDRINATTVKKITTIKQQRKMQFSWI